ncbi:MAG: hypothetical protein M3Q87_05275 [Actinomycetota bacterium]|nr:hypothetical protein [Actinomycetota bacterium]
MSEKTQDEEQARLLTLAKLFDLRTFIGSLFCIFGVAVTIAGITASDAEVARASDLNVSLYSGLAMLVTGIGFIAWMLTQPPVLPEADSKMDRPDSHQ